MTNMVIFTPMKTVIYIAGITGVLLIFLASLKGIVGISHPIWLWLSGILLLGAVALPLTFIKKTREQEYVRMVIRRTAHQRLQKKSFKVERRKKTPRRIQFQKKFGVRRVGGIIDTALLSRRDKRKR